MRSIIERISPEKDLAKLNTNIPRSLASSIPDPILYEHGAVGECNDLIFGFSLTDYATARGLPEGETPRIVRLCIEQIDKRGLESEGIYRVRRSTYLLCLAHKLRIHRSLGVTPLCKRYVVSLESANAPTENSKDATRDRKG